VVAQHAGAPPPPEMLVSGIIPPLADPYLQRVETGIDLKAGLFHGETVVLTHGEETETAPAAQGGTGKTQLAVEFSHALRNARAVDVLVWVAAASREAIVAGFAQAAGAVGAGDPDAGALAAAVSFTGWLARTERRWALILDDLADLADLDGLWPGGPNGQIVITTRLPGAAFGVGAHAAASGLRIAPVSGFSRREALSYVSSRLSDYADQRIEALDLAEDLDGLPIGLVQAVSVMNANRLSCQEYRAQFGERRGYMSGRPVDGVSPAVLATWSLAAECAHQLVPAGLAWPGLALTAVLDAHGIPGAVLTSPAACGFIAGRPSSATGQDQNLARTAITNLARAGLVTIDPTSAVRTVRMQRCVQTAVRAYLSPADTDLVFVAAADALFQAWPEPGNGQSGGPELDQALRDCAISLRAAQSAHGPGAASGIGGGAYGAGAGQGGQAGQAGQGGQAGRGTQGRQRGTGGTGRQGAAGEARGAGGQGAAGGTGAAGGAGGPEGSGGQGGPGAPGSPGASGGQGGPGAPGSPGASGGQGGPGAPGSPGASGRQGGPGAGAGAAWSAGSGQPGPDAGLAHDALWQPEAHPMLFRLGRSMEDGRLGDSAMAHWQFMVAASIRRLGPVHPDSLAAKERLAVAYETAGRLGDAIAMFAGALGDRERSTGPEHPDAIAARGRLAHAYVSAGLPTEAVVIYEHMVADSSRQLGLGHPVTLAARAGLADAYTDAGRTDQALTTYQMLSVDTERLLGPRHPTTLAARDNLAAAFLANGKAGEAVNRYKSLLADYEAMSGPDHPDTIAARASLASAYRRSGKHKDAIAQYKRVLEDRGRTAGADHPDTIAARANLAFAYRSAGQLREAIRDYERTLADRERIAGPDHADTRVARCNLAAAYQQADRLSEAVQQYERALADSERMLGPGGLETLTTRASLASTLYAGGRLMEGIAVLQRALADSEHYLGPDHPMTKTVRDNLDAATRT
jgi:tetratricopeptide (TPR) repeat protein